MADARTKPTIARIWRGRVPEAKADAYARYNDAAGIRPLEEKALGVQSPREDRGAESEFITISCWESVEAMARFTAHIGADPGDHRQPRQLRRHAPDLDQD